nr:Gfo/Idh/MocA family oxidoreductase [Rheinheimera sp. SA_1]
MASHSDTSERQTYSLCIIGAGALGSRHLQAMAKLHFANICVVDPSPAALATAEQRWVEVVDPSQNSFATFTADLPTHISCYDLVVIATSAMPRLKVMQDLLEKCTVKALILEKVLFTQLSEYSTATALLTQYAVPAWVNCTRRTFRSYKELKAMLPVGMPLHVRVAGGEWGLGCNAIHFIDLVSYLSDDQIMSVDTKGLDPGSIPSKRQGYVEFGGSVDVYFKNGSQLELVSSKGKHRHLIELRVGEHQFLIDEVKKQLLYCLADDTVWRTVAFHLPPTSGSMTAVYQSILQHRHCDLPDFHQSSQQHKQIIAALSKHLGGDFASNGICPIT